MLVGVGGGISDLLLPGGSDEPCLIPLRRAAMASKSVAGVALERFSLAKGVLVNEGFRVGFSLRMSIGDLDFD